MNCLIDEMYEFEKCLKKSDNIKKLISYFDNKFYVLVLLRQYERLLINLKSIDALVKIDSVEDAYTIFRKYIETYVIIMSIYENKEVVNEYMIHDSYLGFKACGMKKDEIKYFTENKPDGFLEYGYLESIVDTSKDDFKYTIKTVCKAASLDGYYNWYRLCNNFVHNNLSSVQIDSHEGQSKLIEKCKISFNLLKKKFQLIIQ